MTMKQVLNNIKLLAIFALVFSFVGCEDDDETPLPEVAAGFTFETVQGSGTVSFINISENADSFEWDFGNGETSEEINPTVTYPTGTYTVTLTASNVAGASEVFEDEITIQIADPMAPFDSGLLTNGVFENGSEPWIGGGLNVETEEGNSFNLVEVTVAGNPFDVNLSQVVELSQGTNYTLTFDASASVNRTMLAGIGLNEAPFTNTAPSVDLTTDTQTFTLQLSAADFGNANSRVLFDMGAEVGTVVIDNVSLVEGGDGSDSTSGEGGGSLSVCDGGELVNDFETSDDSIFSNFGGGVGTIIDNADTSVNSSAKVAQYVKNAGEVFGGITIALDSNLDLNNGTFTIDVNSQSVRQLLFKLEGLNEELIIPTSGTGWETISYDFTGNAGEVTGITLIMDNGTAGDGSADWTIQFDNIRLCDNESTGGGSTLDVCDGGELVNDFETSDDSIFSNFGGGVGTIIDNADTSVNSSAKVAQYVKNAGEVFGGITIALDSNLNLNNGTFTIDVNSQSVRQLLFKLEGLNQELIIPTSGTGWETISYDFTGNAGEVTGITLIMDNGTAGDGSADWTIQFDNIRLCDNESTGGGSTLDVCDGGELVNDFETSDDSIFSNFGGGVGTIIDNADTSVNSSAKVAQYVKNAGEVFGGITIALDSNLNLNNGTFTIDVNSQSVRQLLFKLEGLNQELIIPTSGTGWETISYDFTGNAGEVTGITLIMDNGTAGDGSADWTIQFDNIRLCDNESTGGGTGGGTCPAPPTGELLSNGDFEANSGDGACWQLNQGGGSVVIIDSDADTGTYSARLTTGPSQVPNLKQERFGTSVAGGQNIQVTFRYKVTSNFVMVQYFKY